MTPERFLEKGAVKQAAQTVLDQSPVLREQILSRMPVIREKSALNVVL